MAKSPNEALRAWGPWIGVALVAVPFQGYFYAPEKTTSVVTWCWANVALAPLVLFAVLALHQAVMAGTARLLGDYVGAIAIGVGPTIWPRGGRPSRVTIRLFPINYSHAIYTARAEGQRRRTALVYLAGALALIVVIVLPLVCEPGSWHALRAEPGRRLAPDILAVHFAALPVLYSLGSLAGLAGIPGHGLSPVVLQARRVRGAALFCSFASKRGAYREALEIARRGLDEVPKDELLGTVVAELLVMLRDPSAMDVLDELDQRELAAGYRAAVANLWAWEAYMRDDLGRRDVACQRVEQIARDAPNDLSLADTHAHMLLWMGRDTAAEQQLTRVESSSPRASTRASSACGLAMLHARRGDRATARRWLARARELDANNMLIARVAQLVESPGTERL